MLEKHSVKSLPGMGRESEEERRAMKQDIQELAEALVYLASRQGGMLRPIRNTYNPPPAADAKLMDALSELGLAKSGQPVHMNYPPHYATLQATDEGAHLAGREKHEIEDCLAEMIQKLEAGEPGDGDTGVSDD